MKKIILFLIFFCRFFLPQKVEAIVDPLNYQNNRVGIHIVDENDLQAVSELVNSTGGKWGYVKFVIREDDRDRDKWQNIFNQLRRKKLIPIVRLATRVENGMWKKPEESEINSWADFLHSLNWVTENRYVVIFNEPNHSKEWGGSLEPEEYARILKKFSNKLKNTSPDFFILPAGLDSAASNTHETMDEVTFIERLVNHEPDIFQSIDGWTSHSYPQSFTGNVFDVGRNSLRTYEWERSEFSRFGIDKLPIFILETGWKHSEGIQIHFQSPSPDTVANYFAEAFSNIFNDQNIVTVTPFLLNYQGEPFDHFSWRKLNSPDFYPMYETVKNLPKVTGDPKIKRDCVIKEGLIPERIFAQLNTIFSLEIENTGQAIIEKNDGWHIAVENLTSDTGIEIPEIIGIEPFQKQVMNINVKSQTTGEFTVKFKLLHNNDEISSFEKKIAIIPPPKIVLRALEWHQKPANGDDFSLIIYDEKEQIIFEQNNINFTDGSSIIENIYNLQSGKKYRLVLTKPFYLPRQTEIVLDEGSAEAVFEPLLPLDPTQDGTFSASDLTNALDILSRIAL